MQCQSICFSWTRYRVISTVPSLCRVKGENERFQPPFLTLSCSHNAIHESNMLHPITYYRVTLWRAPETTSDSTFPPLSSNSSSFCICGKLHMYFGSWVPSSQQPRHSSTSALFSASQSSGPVTSSSARPLSSFLICCCCDHVFIQLLHSTPCL